MAELALTVKPEDGCLLDGYNFQWLPPIYNYFDICFCVKKGSNYAIQHLQINTSGLTDIWIDMSSVLQFKTISYG